MQSSQNHSIKFTSPTSDWGSSFAMTPVSSCSIKGPFEFQTSKWKLLAGLDIAPLPVNYLAVIQYTCFAKKKKRYCV